MVDQGSSNSKKAAGVLEIPQIKVEELQVKKPRSYSDTAIFNVVPLFRNSGQFSTTADSEIDNIHLAVKSKKERSKTRTNFGSTEKALDFITKLKDDFSAKLQGSGNPKSNNNKILKESRETVSN